MPIRSRRRVEETTATTVTNTPSIPPLTAEIVAEAMRNMHNNSNYIFNADYGSSPAHNLLRDSYTLQRMRMEAEHQNARSSTQRNPVSVEIRVDREGRHPHGDVEIASDFSGQVVRTYHEGREISYGPRGVNDDLLRMIARDHSRRISGMLEQEIFRQLRDGIGSVQRLPPTDFAPRGFAHEMMRHTFDLAAGGLNYVGDRITGAEQLSGEIACLKKFKHKVIDSEGWTATLLDTAEAIREEGRVMEHCLGSTYTKRIANGDYVAFHIKPPEGVKPQSGFTLGFHVKTKRKPYSYDQLKGKKNSTHYCADPVVLNFISLIEHRLNGKKRKKEPRLAYVPELEMA